MKQKRLLIGALMVSAMAFGALTPHMLKQSKNQRIGKDNADYGEELVVDYNNPVMRGTTTRADTQAVTGLELHYHNDDGLCGTREFWIWCNGVNGAAFAPEVSADGKDMVIAFSFTGEYEGFAGKKGFFFIVKTVGTWAGQSANIEVSYADFPTEDGTCVIWAIPGEGNAVELYPSEELTKMDRFQIASFKDWKTIEVLATAVPSSYRLYALTSNYMAHTLSADLNDYLIASGGSPECTQVEYNSGLSQKFEIKLNFTAKVNVQYYLEGEFPDYPGYTKTKYIASHSLYETERFETYYTYNGNDLGATYNGSNSTTFKVWAPTAANVRVYIYDSGSPSDYKDQDPTASDDFGAYNMVFRPGGIWEVTITGRDLAGKYYNYYVANSLGFVTTIDPYAKACGVNGQRGMIVNWNTTNPAGWDAIPEKWDGVTGYDIAHPNDLSIYETHIRDLTMDETWTGNSLRGTYSAFSEPGTTYSKDGVTVTTGYDHIKELGIKAVQLVPVFDNDNLEGLNERSYNWGYNPQNYNCIDGSYATDPYNGASRITEFKQMIQNYAINGNNTRIIMDVVYNHVSNIDRSPFHKLMPRYYFRYTEGGSPYDGSGCGNEVKSEAPMMSKYIVDSLCWWAKEYKIKGFRFDLMALIDFKTLIKAAQELYKIDPDIYLYGEGWSADGNNGNMDNHNPGDKYYGNWGANTWTILNKLKKQGEMCYVGGFNDGGRNCIAGETGQINDWGFIDQGSDYVGDKSETIADMLAGINRYPSDGTFKRFYDDTTWMYDPNQCINYASCHDDFTLFDHLMNCLNGSMTSDWPGLSCAATAATECTIMFSNGVAFMRGGEETFQSKEVSAEDLAEYGDDRTVLIRGKYISSNSYRLSDYTNAFRWDRKISIDGVSTTKYFDAIKDAVHARNKIAKYTKEDLVAHSPFSSSSPMNIWNHGNGSTVIGMKNGEYFFFVAGCNDNNIPFDAIKSYNKQVFSSNPAYNWKEASGTDYLKLGWYMCVCLTK